MKKIIAIGAALVVASSVTMADCEPVDRLSAVTTISATAHVSADLVAPGVHVTGEHYDPKQGRTNGAIHYKLTGEQEPWVTLFNVSFAGGCTPITKRQ